MTSNKILYNLLMDITDNPVDKSRKIDTFLIELDLYIDSRIKMFRYYPPQPTGPAIVPPAKLIPTPLGPAIVRSAKLIPPT